MATWTNVLGVLDTSEGGWRTFATTDMIVTGADWTFSGSVIIQADLTVQGTMFVVETEQVLVEDNYFFLNFGYTVPVAHPAGLVTNYLPTATTTTVAAGGFVAGIPAVSNPTVATVGVATFAVSDLIMINGATKPENNGLFEVLSHVGNILTIRGIGLVATVEDFTQNQFLTNAGAVGTITKVTLSIIRAGIDGLWEVGTGAATPIVFTDIALTSSGLDNIVYVDKGADPIQDGSFFHPYHTIAAAVVAAGAGDMIYIAPGTYAETGLVSKAGVNWQGSNEGQVIIQGVGTILTITDATTYQNITFDVTDAATIVSVNVAAGTTRFEKCEFQENGNNGNAIILANTGTIVFDQCNIAQTAEGFTALTSAATIVRIYRTTYMGALIYTGGEITYRSLDGNGASVLNGCTIFFAQDCKLASSTSGILVLIDSQLDVYGCSFYCDFGISFDVTTTSVAISGNYFYDAGGFTSSIQVANAATVTCRAFSNNMTILGVGLTGTGVLTHPHPVKHVGGIIDAFKTVQGALYAVIGANQTIVLHQNTVLAGALVVPDTHMPVIDGQNQYEISRGAGLDIVNLAANKKIIFKNVDLVGRVTVNGNGAEAHLLTNTYLVGIVYVVSGNATTIINIDKARISGDVTDLYCVRLIDAAPFCTIKYSWLKGSTNPAIYYDTNTNNNLKIAYSTIMHGSLGANDPIGRSGVQTPTFYSHHNSYNTDPNGGLWLTNGINLGQWYDSFDADGDY